MAMVEPVEEIPIMVEEAAPEPDPAPVPRRPRHYDELADLIFGPKAAVVTESGPDDGPTKQPPSSATKRVAQDGQSDGEGGDALGMHIILVGASHGWRLFQALKRIPGYGISFKVTCRLLIEHLKSTFRKRSVRNHHIHQSLGPTLM